jgi:hypothetical protein
MPFGNNMGGDNQNNQQGMGGLNNLMGPQTNITSQ